jgi:hypothetical protein
MRFGGFGQGCLAIVLSAGALLHFAASSSYGQQLPWDGGQQNCPRETCPPSKEYPPLPPGAEAHAPSAEQPEPFLPPERFAALGGETVALATPNMIGDVLVPSGSSRQVIFSPRIVRSFTIPSAGHGFKMADDGNPLPQDRVFLSYNFFNNVNREANRRLGADIGTIDVHREVMGLEKSILDGSASLSLLFPLNTLTAEGSSTPGLAGTWTDIGDLTVVLKGVLWEDRTLGNGLSVGLAVTLPTGPDSFARVGSVVNSIHDTLFQPFLGLIWNISDFYFIGFSAVDIPADSNDVTLFFNDIGVGYYLYHNRQSERVLTAVAPTVEVHGNTPLSHRGLTPDWLDVTGGTTFVLKGRATVAIGVSTPVTGSKPFDVEATAHINIRF